MSDLIVETRDLTVHAGQRALLRGVNLRIQRGHVAGLIGPSGAGKSTLLRCINRLNELVPGLRVTGDVFVHGDSIYEPGTDVNQLRARVGMLFQQPVVFPTSIGENVIFGAKRLRKIGREERASITEAALREAAIWDEVKDRLNQPATVLSVGQQQRLCLARALAVQPEVILMDEPTSALDPKSTVAIEELILRIKERHTVFIVTHNIAQARRVCDWVAFVNAREGTGEIVESGSRDAVLGSPQSTELVEYLRHST